jgi:hypothetical protein
MSVFVSTDSSKFSFSSDHQNVWSVHSTGEGRITQFKVVLYFEDEDITPGTTQNYACNLYEWNITFQKHTYKVMLHEKVH